jgi:regulator of protease activity HflC (stomatin/prohibitin superfamily)
MKPPQETRQQSFFRQQMEQERRGRAYIVTLSNELEAEFLALERQVVTGATPSREELAAFCRDAVHRAKAKANAAAEAPL